MNDEISKIGRTPIEGFYDFKRFISRKTGLSKIDDKLLLEVASNRIKELNLFDYYNYIEFLNNSFESKNEFQRIIQKVANGETYFFRDINQFNLLKYKLIPEVLLRKTTPNFIEKIRILSLGCATGEEPYTIAILMKELEKIYYKMSVDIIAADINISSMEFAREGIYYEKSVKQIPMEYMPVYFTRKNDACYLSDDIKNMVQFRYLNLVEDPFPFDEYGRGVWDIIFCRNVFIYFEDNIIKRVLKNIASLLDRKGYLFTGVTANTFIINPGFEPMFYEDTFVYRKNIFKKDSVPFKSEASRLRSIRETTKETTKEETNKEESKKEQPERIIPSIEQKRLSFENYYNQVLGFYFQEDFTNAFILAQQLKKLYPNKIEVNILLTKILVEIGEIEDAQNLCEEFIKNSSIIPEFHFLLGDIYSIKGKDDKAVEEYRKTLFLAPDFGMAYIKLGVIFLSHNKRDKALTEYTNAVDVFKSINQQKYNIFVGSIPIESIIKICQVKISSIKNNSLVSGE